MKKVLKVLIVLLVLWIGLSFYFITQHSVETKEAKLDKTIVFDDLTIELDKIAFYNFKREGFFNNTEENMFKYELLARLPQQIAKTVMRIGHFYSKPYIIENNQIYNTALFGKCIFTPTFSESNEYFDYFGEHISINVKDSQGYGYSRGRGLQDTDNRQEIDFSIRGRDFPIERLQEGVKIIIKHLESGEEREFTIESQDFIEYKYNDLFGKPVQFSL